MTHSLPLLDARRTELETCTFCPKLCRGACPVSNAEPNESLIPWGKMSTSHAILGQHLALDDDGARAAYACTGCHACKKTLCDHENEVFQTLVDARSDYFARGVVHPKVQRLVDRHGKREVARAGRIEALRDAADARGSGGAAKASVLVGCAYVDRAFDEARAAVVVASRLSGGPVTPLGGCCGFNLYLAGARDAFLRAAQAFAASIPQDRPLYVVDAGCAFALEMIYPRLGVRTPKPRLLIDLAAERLDDLQPVAGAKPVRYHDPCHLGRGLERYAEPRAILRRVTGHAPLEFTTSETHATCSGGGGLLPLTMPETSRKIAETKIADHARRSAGGEKPTLVTACASSLARFRSVGEPAEDLVTWMLRGTE